MKRLIFLSIAIPLVFISCKKSDISEKEKQKGLLLSQINEIVDLKMESQAPKDLNLQNELNPYEFVGDVVGKTTYEVLAKFASNKSDPDSLSTIFMTSLKQKLSSDSFFMDTTNIDLMERTIFNFLIDIYIKEGFNSYIIKSKQIENIVLTSCYFEENQKERVLIYSSSIRHVTGMIEKFISGTKSINSETFKECWQRKLQEMQDCKNCFFENLACIFTWPECLGLKALDCLAGILWDIIFSK